MATAFDTIFSDFSSFLISAVIIFFTVFFFAGLALVFALPDKKTPEEKKEEEKGPKSKRLED